MYQCWLCHQYARKTLNGILRHIREVHPHFEGRVMCGINGCPSTASTYESLRQHLYRKHAADLKSELPSDHTPQVTIDESPADDEFGSSDNQEPVEDAETGEQQQLNAAKFILKTREGRKLTQVAMNGVVHDVQTMLQSTLEAVEQKFLDKIKAGGVAITEEQLEDLRSVFSGPSSNPFQGLETEYKQEAFFKENFNYVVPVERVLGRSEQLDSSGKMKEVRECYYYVPLLESIQALLHCESVRDQIFNSHKLPQGKLGDYCDGSQFQQHPLFQKDPCALQIHFYYDDVEVCNPLGSKAVIHKVGLFYYQLGNIDPKYRSTLHTIQLLAVVKCAYIEKYGMNIILEPMMEAVKELETDTGVPFTVDGARVNFRGTLTIGSADNPAACLMGGYKALHSALRKCRSCMATGIDIQEKFRESQVQLRTRETHAYHAASLGGLLHEHTATTYGVTSRSILNHSRYFHVVDGLSPDIMHDVLEGTLQLSLKQLLLYLTEEKKLFAVDTLNERIHRFNYGPQATNKPVPIKATSLTSSDACKLKQSASQAWCLGRFFPLLVGDLVPEGDEKWENYLDLMTIVDYIFAPVTTPDKCSYLKFKIEEFLFRFRELYPDRTLIPKMHYIIHIPSWMARCGPLVRTWCMRFEAKHSYFKRIAGVVRNFKNIEKTIAHRHQRYMCYKMTCTTDFLCKDPAYGPGRTAIVDELEYGGDIVKRSTELTPKSSVNRVSYAEVLGTKYQKDVVVLVTFDDDIPIFGRIKDIIVSASGECLFVFVPYVGALFNYHYHSYEVHAVHNQYLICRHEEFADFQPLSISHSFKRSLFTKNFVCLKYHVFE